MKNQSAVWGLIIVTCAGTGGCGSAVAPEATQNAPPSGDNAPALSVASAQPVPVVAIPLQNGNVLEFYDMSAGVLVSEVGLARVDPIVDMHSPNMKAHRWVAAVAS